MTRLDSECIAYLRKPFAQDVLLNSSSGCGSEPVQPQQDRAGSPRPFGGHLRLFDRTTTTSGLPGTR